MPETSQKHKKEYIWAIILDYSYLSQKQANVFFLILHSLWYFYAKLYLAKQLWFSLQIIAHIECNGNIIVCVWLGGRIWDMDGNDTLYVLLRHTRFPKILTEPGFISFYKWQSYCVWIKIKVFVNTAPSFLKLWMPLHNFIMLDFLMKIMDTIFGHRLNHF